MTAPKQAAGRLGPAADPLRPGEAHAPAGGEPRRRRAAHGTHSRYVLGCRCKRCKAANSAYSAAYRQRMQDIPFRMVPHGTLHGYDTFGCRCDACTAVKQAVNRRRYESHPEVEPVPAGHKRCSRCREIKSYDDFYAELRVPDGRRAECKECHLRDRRAAYWKRKEAAA